MRRVGVGLRIRTWMQTRADVKIPEVVEDKLWTEVSFLLEDRVDNRFELIRESTVEKIKE